MGSSSKFEAAEEVDAPGDIGGYCTVVRVMAIVVLSGLRMHSVALIKVCAWNGLFGSLKVERISFVVQEICCMFIQ